MREWLRFLTASEGGLLVVMLIGGWLLERRSSRSHLFGWALTIFTTGAVWRCIVGFHRAVSPSVPMAVVRMSVVYHVLIIVGLIGLILSYRRALGPRRSYR